MALVYILLLLFSFSTKTITSTQAQCLPDQRHILIQLKKDFITTELHSWNASTNCCIWDGISCDEKTGMVTALNLNNRSISGELHRALFNLSSLRYLNLADNNFINTSLPQTGFERLANLTHLYLSNSGFVGQVPMSISALTNLISLDLSDVPFDFLTDSHNHFMYLHGTDLNTLLSNLTKLQVLRVDGVDLSLNGFELGKAIFQVGPTLKVLSMVDCGLRGNLPDEIFHLTNLTELSLAQNSMLSGQLSEFRKLSLLQYLTLATINFTGSLPDSIGNLQYLTELSLPNCNLYGEIPTSIINHTRLDYLDLEFNKLTGMIPISLFSHPSLKSLHLSRNQLSGYLPEFSHGSSILEVTDISYNNLQGKLPISIFSSTKLMFLDLSSNNFNGILNLDVIKQNKNLNYLFLSNNNLSIIEGKNHNDSFYASFPQMIRIGLASCNLIKFPSFLSYQTNIYSLDLSNNSLTEDIPLSICNVKLPTYLDLSYNNLIGTIPPCLLEDNELEVLNLKSNRLSGSLPRNISQSCRLQAINLNGNLINGGLPELLMYCNDLEVLDLGNNRIVDKFPYWLGNLENLRVLVLRSNMFYGKISDVDIKTEGHDSFFPMLKVLDLSSNHFNGTLPKNIIGNLKAMMGESNTNSVLYYLLKYAINIPNVVSITYKGLSFDLKYSLGILSYIDLSNNEFLGKIPEEIGQLKSLNVLNLSHNDLTSRIPLEFANLHELQSLDLSCNKLSGHIPKELTSLTFLFELNVSYNNLDGEIPPVPQFSTFSSASYMGNPRLCGSPLSIQCVTTPNQGFYKGFPSESSTDIIGLSVSIGVGLGVGFASVIWATISWENGRKRFNFIIDRFYIRYFTDEFILYLCNNKRV